jgi:hypothetical protein
MSAHAPTSRTREAPQGDEEASSELKLGEFQDVDALTHSEAALVINALVSKRSADRKNVNETEYALLFLLSAVGGWRWLGLGKRGMGWVERREGERGRRGNLGLGGLGQTRGKGWRQTIGKQRLTPKQDALQNPRLPRSFCALQTERERRSRGTAAICT